MINVWMRAIPEKKTGKVFEVFVNDRQVGIGEFRECCLLCVELKSDESKAMVEYNDSDGIRVIPGIN